MYQQQTLRISLIIFFAGMLIGCANGVQTGAIHFQSPIRTTCDTEAQQLNEPAVVYPAPKPGLVPIAKLDQGRFVYRCAQQGEWLGVMFPAVGEKVDCAERQPEQACSLGWIRRETKMEIFG